jgi:hypothetical protein
MNWESVGFGAGGGIVVTILTALGWNRRMNNLEEKKQDRNVCEVLHKSIDTQLGDLKKGQDAIFDKLDNINEFLRNHK